MPGRIFKNSVGKSIFTFQPTESFFAQNKLLKHQQGDNNMAGRRTRHHTAEEVHRIVMDVPDDSDISDFEGEDGDDASEYV